MQAILHPLIGPAGPEVADLTGKTAIVTGGALGIGYEISRFFALYGCRVIMINRKSEQGDEAIAKIQKEFKETTDAGKTGQEAKIEWIGCDLGSLKEVKDVFGGLAKTLDRLDLLILSAGINSNQWGLSADGIDRHFQVNALGHYYAINLLYPLLRKTSTIPGTIPGSVRIVFESSEMHRFAPPSLDNTTKTTDLSTESGSSSSVSIEKTDFNPQGVRGRGLHFASEDEITEGGKELGPMELYGRTKLAMILYGKALVKKVIEKQGDDIKIISVHPGAVNTDMQEQWKDSYPGVLGQVVAAVTYATGRSPEQGSYSALYAALSQDIVAKGWNGVYLSDPAVLGKETPQACDTNLGTALWELSERMVKRVLGEDALVSWSLTA